MGNIIELCAANQYPDPYVYPPNQLCLTQSSIRYRPHPGTSTNTDSALSSKTYLGFTFCMTQDYKDIPQLSLIQDCALEHGMDFEKLNECALKDDGGFGIELLRDSVRRSTAAGVTKSCTVRLNEEIYCVRDDGEWKDCPHGPGVNDLVLAVEKLYQSGP